MIVVYSSDYMRDMMSRKAVGEGAWTYSSEDNCASAPPQIRTLFQNGRDRRAREESALSVNWMTTDSEDGRYPNVRVREWKVSLGWATRHSLDQTASYIAPI